MKKFDFSRKLSIEHLNPRILLHGGTCDTDCSDFDGNNYIDQRDLQVWASSPNRSGSDFLNWQRNLSKVIDHTNNPHDGDPAKHAEHNALFSLINRSSATHIAISDGSWSDPSVWDINEVPTAGSNVLILSDTEVIIDSVIQERMNTVRVDGRLIFANDVDTELTVETLVFAPSAYFEIGTADNPVVDNVTAKIIVADNGAIDTNWDEGLLTRGVINHGQASIYGAAKTAHTETTTQMVDGTNSLTFSTPVEGWNVGDRLLIPSTDPYAEDEVVTIASITDGGLTVNLDSSLVNDHLKERADFRLPVSNLDRNIIIESENKTDVNRAGHLMFMHNSNVNINYFMTNHIGRTDFNELRSATNVPGRYAVHFHRTGTANNQVIVNGAVAMNNQGWGFVNHDSNVLMTNNVSYNIKGAGFVTEIGTEVGSIINNVAIRSTGKFYLSQSASDKGDHEGFGSQGHGFWLQSARTNLIDNVAAGHAQEAIFIHGRQFTEADRDEPVTIDGVTVGDTPLANIENNEAFASGRGLHVRWRRRPDDGNVDNIDGIKIWNVKWGGIALGYINHLKIENATIIGNEDDPIPLTNEESSNRSETREVRAVTGKGLVANRNSKNLKLENFEVRGFYVGIQALSNTSTVITNPVLSNVEDILVVTPQDTRGGSRYVTITNAVHIPLANQTDHYDIRLLKQLDRAGVAGSSQPQQEWPNFITDDIIYHNGNRLFYEDQAANAVPFGSDQVPNWMLNSPYSQYLNKTNTQLMNEFGIALGGMIAV